jgi:hypothetical protein
MRRSAIALLLLAAITPAGAGEIDAIVWQLGSGRGMFVEIAARPARIADRDLIVICARDGSGEVIANVDDTFVAVNGAARRFRTGLWVLRGRALIRVRDLEAADSPLERIKAGPIIEAGNALCPSGLIDGMAQRAVAAMLRAVETYRHEAPRRGIRLP